jgi:simple sugar transport system permease protein
MMTQSSSDGAPSTTTANIPQHPEEPSAAINRVVLRAEDTLPAGPVHQRGRHGDYTSTSVLSGLATRLRQTRGRGALEIGVIFVLVQIGCIAYYLANPDSFPYLTKANFNVLSQSVPVLAILAMGAGILIIAGEFDLSLGANFTFCALVFARWYQGGNNALVCIGLALVVGVTIALINGFVTTRFRIPSFIVTLGALLFWEGAALYYNQANATVMTPSATLKTVFTGELGFFRGQALWMLGVGILLWLLIHRHRLGNHIFAVGGNPAAAKAISINPTRVKIIAFGILGACAALAGVLTAIRTGSVVPGSGRGLELQAIAAAVVGGVALSGGKGSVLGMVLGAGLIYTIQDIILLSGLDAFYLQLFVGLIIVVAAIFNRMLEGKAA